MNAKNSPDGVKGIKRAISIKKAIVNANISDVADSDAAGIGTTLVINEKEGYIDDWKNAKWLKENNDGSFE